MKSWHHNTEEATKAKRSIIALPSILFPSLKETDQLSIELQPLSLLLSFDTPPSLQDWAFYTRFQYLVQCYVEFISSDFFSDEPEAQHFWEDIARQSWENAVYTDGQWKIGNQVLDPIRHKNLIAKGGRYQLHPLFREERLNVKYKHMQEAYLKLPGTLIDKAHALTEPKNKVLHDYWEILCNLLAKQPPFVNLNAELDSEAQEVLIDFLTKDLPRLDLKIIGDRIQFITYEEPITKKDYSIEIKQLFNSLRKKRSRHSNLTYDDILTYIQEQQQKQWQQLSKAYRNKFPTHFPEATVPKSNDWLAAYWVKLMATLIDFQKQTELAAPHSRRNRGIHWTDTEPSIDFSLLQLLTLQWLDPHIAMPPITSNQLQSLVTLNLSGMKFPSYDTSHGFSVLVNLLRNNPYLKQATFADMHLTDKAALSILKALENSHLQALDLSDNELGDKTVKPLAQWITKNLELQQLNLSTHSHHATRITQEGLLLLLQVLGERSKKLPFALYLIGQDIGSLSWLIRWFDSNRTLAQKILDNINNYPALQLDLSNTPLAQVINTFAAKRPQLFDILENHPQVRLQNPFAPQDQDVLHQILDTPPALRNQVGFRSYLTNNDVDILLYVLLDLEAIKSRKEPIYIERTYPLSYLSTYRSDRFQSYLQSEKNFTALVPLVLEKPQHFVLMCIQVTVDKTQNPIHQATVHIIDSMKAPEAADRNNQQKLIAVNEASLQFLGMPDTWLHHFQSVQYNYYCLDEQKDGWACGYWLIRYLLEYLTNPNALMDRCTDKTRVDAVNTQPPDLSKAVEPDTSFSELFEETLPQLRAAKDLRTRHQTASNSKQPARILIPFLNRAEYLDDIIDWLEQINGGAWYTLVCNLLEREPGPLQKVYSDLALPIPFRYPQTPQRIFPARKLPWQEIETIVESTLTRKLTAMWLTGQVISTGHVQRASTSATDHFVDFINKFALCIPAVYALSAGLTAGVPAATELMEASVKASKIIKTAELFEAMDDSIGLLHTIQHKINQQLGTQSVTEGLINIAHCFSTHEDCQNKVTHLVKAILFYYSEQLQMLEPNSIKAFSKFIQDRILDYILYGFWEEEKRSSGKSDDTHFVETLIGWLSGYDFRNCDYPKDATLTTLHGEALSAFELLSAPGLVCEDEAGKLFYFHINSYEKDTAKPYLWQDPKKYGRRKALPSEVATLNAAVSEVKAQSTRSLKSYRMHGENVEPEIICEKSDFDTISDSTFKTISLKWQPQIQNHESRIIEMENRLLQLYELYKTIKNTEGISDKLKNLETWISQNEDLKKQYNKLECIVENVIAFCKEHRERLQLHDKKLELHDEKISLLETKIEKQEATRYEVSQENKKLKKRVTDLEAANESKEKQSKELRDENSKLRGKIKKLKKERKDDKKRLDALERKLNQRSSPGRVDTTTEPSASMESEESTTSGAETVDQTVSGFVFTHNQAGLFPSVSSQKQTEVLPASEAISTTSEEHSGYVFRV